MAIFDELKSVAKTLREADKIPQYEQILNIQEKLLEMQKKIFDLEEENRNLKDKLKIKDNVIHERNAYWVIKSTNEKDGPFCTKCRDVNDILVRIRVGDYIGGWAYCPNCRAVVPK